MLERVGLYEICIAGGVCGIMRNHAKLFSGARGIVGLRLKEREESVHFTAKSLLSSCAVGVFLSWLSLSFRAAGAPQFSFPISFLSYPRIDEAWLAALLSLSVCSFLFAVIPRLKAMVPFRRMAVGICGIVLMAGGGAAVLFCSHSFEALVGGGVVAGAGMSALLISWISVAYGVDRNELVRCFVGGFVISCLIDLALLIAAPVVSLALLAVLPIVLLAVAVHRMRQASGAEDDGSAKISDSACCSESVGGSLFSDGTRAATLLFSFMGFAFFMGIMGFNTDLLAPDDLLSHQAALMAGGSTLAAAMLALSWRWGGPESLPVVTLLLIATALLLLPLSAATAASSAAVVLAQASLMCSYAYLVLSLCDGSAVFAPGELVRRCSLAVSIVGVCQLFGIFGGGAVRSIFGLNLTALAFTAMIALYLAFFIILVLTRGRRRVEHVIKGSFASEDEVARIRCGVLFEEYPSLSTREREVLVLLLQNFSNARIAKELVVSDNTVKTHVRHIYEKMGIKSRQQLFELAASIRLESK